MRRSWGALYYCWCHHLFKATRITIVSTFAVIFKDVIICFGSLDESNAITGRVSYYWRSQHLNKTRVIRCILKLLDCVTLNPLIRGTFKKLFILMYVMSTFYQLIKTFVDSMQKKCIFFKLLAIYYNKNNLLNLDIWKNLTDFDTFISKTWNILSLENIAKFVWELKIL